ncbi:hypothetical protein A3J19_02260 [Candidatus Daviesbacteria bacterium RIFCSPLOWO2_02_FULL_41_8]|uniref:Uncharacterized protein n=3 Tax=Candidatus Daviesiibacteriota TaxID=1752718 RepID=A0A1F5NHL3_9BACT|nr:MAG: hypothetical protein A2871_01255 [Candidatus Daviesbacteria bacterium RIFCSPHIGHO2_01_FULL_41_23]OGE32669.1 MAG: hypothetical protein A3D83_01620 [Candidatus Daviesbacteria bacterium RIFCSPHIGHO2_02_FULL_41_10]OGE62522.1 MAG: hypothetical protein A2967_01740 [Candidatus Daviesbacteria bacterium RIFCSPLOWO2_01_FULL_41_32]OGE77118.1 MAG: hypothetical protein A3J19_02260 [Candidatus Daviesbacteria bacterium RIFCSPLOWO2_02_FULL_41_8]
MTEFAGKVHIPRKKVEEDLLGRKVLVVENLDGFPRADNQGLEPGLNDPDSSQHLVVRPAGPEGKAKGSERFIPVRENYPCG